MTPAAAPGEAAPSRGCAGSRRRRSHPAAPRGPRRSAVPPSGRSPRRLPWPGPSCNRWPSRPNPVTSVAARIPAASAGPAASRVQARHRLDRLGEHLAGRLVPVVETSDADRLGQAERQAGLPASFRSSGSGWAMPVTAIPYFGSGSSMVCPPATGSGQRADVQAAAQHSASAPRQHVARPAEQVQRDQRPPPIA